MRRGLGEEDQRHAAAPGSFREKIAILSATGVEITSAMIEEQSLR
jgi:hypothetical protein